MSTNTNEPGPSCSKRKNSDPDEGYRESKCKAEDLSKAEDPSKFEDMSKPENLSITSCASNEQEEDDDCAAKLGDYLSAQYEILLRVLSNLSAFDLRRAAQVSKAWQSAARVARDSRHQFHWLFWRANSGGWNVPPPLALYSSICEHVYSQPTMCVAFFTKTAIKSFECSSPDIICPSSKEYKCCGKLHPMESYMASALGPKCEILSFTVSGIIGSSLDLQSTFEVEHRKGLQSMSAALFPSCPEVKILRFKITKHELLKGVKQHNAQEIDLGSLLGIPRDMLIQALVVFSGSRIRGDEISMLVGCLQSRQEHRMAVAGGIGENRDNIEGLVILGDDVCAASLVIPESVTEKDTVVEYITKIKNCNMPSDRAFCFMFTCLGRGTMWYLGDSNVESTIINKMFPKSPVVGFFGQGEIGMNFLPSFEEQDSSLFWKNFREICKDSKKSLQEPPKVVKRGEQCVDHSYSTCILYLSFNIANSSLPL